MQSGGRGDTQTWVRFIGGLDYKIAHMVEVLPYKSLKDLVQLDYQLEKQQKFRPRYEAPRSNTRVPDAAPSRPVSGPNRPQANVPAPAAKIVPGTSTGKLPIKCYKFHEFGHIASECPNRRVVNLVEAAPEEEMADEAGPK